MYFLEFLYFIRTLELPHFFQKMKSGAQLVRQKKEKSAAILVTIIVVFLLCHIHRLSLRLYEMASPESSIYEHYRYCDKKGCLKSI